MSTPAWPTVDTPVEVGVPTGDRHPSRVQEAGEQWLSLTAPVGPEGVEPPGLGGELTVRWAAGPRGRYALPVTLVATSATAEPVWVVQAAGAARIEQDRHFVRGGGGEEVQLRRVGAPADHTSRGHLVDVGEGSVRARFTGLNIRTGEQVWVQLSLGDAIIPAVGEVFQVITEVNTTVVEVVTVYELPENQARAIRRYVLRQQLLTRSRTAGT
ncbi:MAG TPA: hypothetical protein VF755_25630 [Catenuloplanes sp.]|jgi:hypothetical protein